jgi:hypothetical protein
MWLARSLAVAASPLAELLRLPARGELPNGKARLQAWLVLARLRLFRAYRMLELAIRDDANQVVSRWNRDDAPTGNSTVGKLTGSFRSEIRQ